MQNRVSARAIGGLAAVAIVSLACSDPEVRFGPVNGLRDRTGGSGGDVSGVVCELPDLDGVDTTGATCPPWPEIFTNYFDTDGLYQCSRSGCHGAPNGLAGLTMPEADPAASYAAMAAYTNDDGVAYVQSSSPGMLTGAYLLCNIWADSPNRIPDRHGAIMPPPGTTPQDVGGQGLIDIANWIACGMQQDGGGGPVGTGSGGDMGTGGATGAGGDMQ